MADINEWFKGITFFIVATFLFYFLWDTIFSGIITFLGTDIFGIGSEANTSLTILKAVGWISFIFLWLATTPMFLVYSIIAGSRNEVKTSPLYLLKGIGAWAIMMPVLSFIYGLVHFLTTTLNNADIIDTGMETTATQFSWIMAIIFLMALVFVPFYYILQGYGIELGNKKKGK